MLTKKIFAVLLVLVGLFSAQVMAFDGVLPGHNLYPVQQKIFAAISDYWQVQELFLKYVADPNEENEKT